MSELLIFLLIFLLILSAFFSGSETALMSINMVKVRTLLKEKRKGARALYRLKQNPHKLLITILIGNNIVNIASASLATVIFTEMFGSTGIGVATGIMTFLVLVFGEITPKTMAAESAERFSLLVARPLEILSYLLLPFTKIFETISRLISRFLGARTEKQLSPEELKTIVTMGREEGILSKEAAQMMQNILEFEETKVVDIMTPKVEIAFVDGDKKIIDILDYVTKTPYSRYPVFLKNKDNIIGILDVDDVLKNTKRNRLHIKVKNITRNVLFVPETKPIKELFLEFERKETPMAIVVDEYGNVRGLVTLEDILEEIVGDIFDKSLRREVYIKPISEKMIRADAKLTIEEAKKLLGIGIREKHFNTLAGFIEHKLGRIPKPGEKIELKKVTIVVEKADKQRIKKVKIIKK